MAQPDGRITYCNQYWLDYTGLTLEQTVADGWVQAVHPDYRLRALRLWKQAVEADCDYEVEVPFRRHSDGQQRWHLVRGVPARDVSGQVTKWVGIAIDIYERTKAEQIAARANQRFEMAEAAGRSFVFEWDAITGTVERSKGFSTVTGYSGAGEIAPTPAGWRAHSHPDDVARLCAEWERLLVEGASYEIEYRVRHKLGYFLWVRERGVVERDVDGRATRIVGITTDITGHKRQQELAVQLLANEQQHARRMQQLYETSLSINRASTVEAIARLAVDQARALTGAQMGVLHLVPEGDWSRATTTASFADQYAAWRDYATQPTGSGLYMLACEEKRTMRLTARARETHPRWGKLGREAGKHPPLGAWMAAPLLDSRNEYIGVLQLSHKVATDEPALSAAPQLSAETMATPIPAASDIAEEFTATDEALLGQLAQMASIAIEKQRLYEQEQAARTSAETANRLKDDFLSTVSHELRTPLNAINGWIKMLRAGGLDEAATAESDGDD